MYYRNSYTISKLVEILWEYNIHSKTAIKHSERNKFQFAWKIVRIICLCKITHLCYGHNIKLRDKLKVKDLVFKNRAIKIYKLRLKPQYAYILSFTRSTNIHRSILFFSRSFLSFSSRDKNDNFGFKWLKNTFLNCVWRNNFYDSKRCFTFRKYFEKIS